jgi:hypothetical protein
MGARGALFVSCILVRLSPDSARTKNTMAKMVASQKTGRTAFDLFILVTPFLRASVPYVYRTAADALRFNARHIEQEVPRKASRIKVTELLPAQCADVLPDFEPTPSGRANEHLWFLAAKLFQ